MNFTAMNETAIMSEIGRRVRRQRLNKNITQEAMSEKAGITRTVIQRIEEGKDYKFTSLIRILRGLDCLDQIDLFLPEPGISPLQIAKLQGRVRQRAAKRKP